MNLSRVTRGVSRKGGCSSAHVTALLQSYSLATSVLTDPFLFLEQRPTALQVCRCSFVGPSYNQSLRPRGGLGSPFRPVSPSGVEREKQPHARHAARKTGVLLGREKVGSMLGLQVPHFQVPVTDRTLSLVLCMYHLIGNPVLCGIRTSAGHRIYEEQRCHICDL